MRKLVNAEVLQHSMKLEQMGAKVKVINSKLCYINFYLEGIHIKYIYNINKNGNYFLERIKPYQMPVKECRDEADVVEVISIDVEQFRNAANSHHVQEFIKTSETINNIQKKFEDLYLYYNISTECMEDLVRKLDEFDKAIDNTKDSCERLYFKKEPENL